MMTRGPAGAERHRSLTVQHRIHSGHRPATGVHRGVETARADHRVGIDRTTAGSRQRLDTRDQPPVVDAGDRLDRSRWRIVCLPSHLIDRGPHRGVAGRLVGVRPWIMGGEEVADVRPVGASL